MLLNNYTIPENITAEEEFMYNLNKKFYCAGSCCGIVLGAISALIDHMKEDNTSSEIIKETEDVYEAVNANLKEYIEISNFARQRWEELGKPLSLAAHQAKKKRLDEEDEKKLDL